MVLRSIGPLWDGNEVWLLVAGGATFAAFPGWYATLFSGAYLALFLVLLSLIVRNVAFEFWGKHDDPRWRAAWEWVGHHRLRAAGPAVGRGVGQHHPRHPDRRPGRADRAAVGPARPVRAARRRGDPAAVRRPRRDVPVPEDLWRGRRARGRGAARAGARGRRGPGRLGRLDRGRRRRRRGDRPARAARSCCCPRAAAVRAAGWSFGATAGAIGLLVASWFVQLFPHVLISSTNPDYSITLHAAASGDYTLKVMTGVAVLLVPLVLLYQGWTYWVFRRRLTADD